LVIHHKAREIGNMGWLIPMKMSYTNWTTLMRVMPHVWNLWNNVNADTMEFTDDCNTLEA
jgi:hypothetical protein